mgnify:CR=1 FL=1
MERRDFLRLMGVFGGGLLLDLHLAWALEKIDPTKVSAVLKAGGGTVGGIGYVEMTGVAKVTGDAYPKIQITVVPGGWIGNIPRTNKGELDLASTTKVMTQLAVQRKGAFTDPYPNVKGLMNVQDEYQFVAVVRKDFPAKTVGEIVRKKIPARLSTLAKGNATEWIWRTAFEELGASWEDLEKWGGKMNHVAWADAVNLVKDGHADGILAVVTGRIGWMMDLATARDVKWLHWDKDLKDMLIKKYGFEDGVLPAGLFRGLDEPVPAPTDGGVVIVRADLEKEVAYAIARAVSEGAEKFKTYHAALEKFTPKNMAKRTGGFPLHEGARIYYQEKGWL